MAEVKNGTAIAVLVGAVVIGIAIYAKPSNYDRCVDRLTENFSDVRKVESDDNLEKITLAAARFCAPGFAGN